jgi:hypothetical protein
MYYRMAGRGAPPCVRSAIRWVRQCLGKDPQVLADAKRLGKVCKMSKEDLCLCYKD